MLLGLLAPSSGQLSVDGLPLSTLDGEAMRRRVVYVPQTPYLSPTRSVRWHLALMAAEHTSDDALWSALRRVGLESALVAHESADPLAVHVGELSGGERRRLQLARVFLTDNAELIVLDEPEAGIDRAGREMLRGLIAGLAERSRVMLIAQDETIIPAGFERLKCTKSPSG
jgi:ABC-type transport system involved in cytochrome bd biosynthesis fused ATPase/permease subunit